MGKKTLLTIVITAAIVSALVSAFFAAYPLRLSNNPGNFATKSLTTAKLQSDVESVVKQYQPIVVSIVASKDVPTIRRCQLEPVLPFFEDPFFGDFGAIRRNCTIENKRVQTSGGTGFVVDSRGIILTNKHVVADTEAEYTVLFNDGKEDKVANIYRDPNTDVALVKINRNLTTVAKLGDSKAVTVGDFVVAMGNALGEFQNSASFGIISGLERNITAGDQLGANSEKLQKVFQTDAAINPGNSGGPLINMNGEVVGVNTAIAAQAQNIGFAIPINTIKPIIQQFIR